VFCEQDQNMLGIICFKF